MYYIFHGEDEFSRTEEVNRMRAEMGDPQFADLNTTRFDGKKVGLGELQHACNAIPFLADRRVVIVEGMLARLDPRRKKGEEGGEEEAQAATGQELARELEGLLDQLPEHVRLFFLESKTLSKTNPILKYAASDKGRGYIREFAPLKEAAVPEWIQGRVKAKGGAIEVEAVNALAANIGPDLRLIDAEIEKLLAYRRQERIRAADVRNLVASVREANIFELVDAVGERRTDRALLLLHKHLDDRAEPPQLMGMIARQFRLLFQVKDLGARGLSVNEMAERLGAQSWIVGKVWKQSQRFTLERLEEAYALLLESDLAMKTGRSEPTVALDLLIMQLTR
jgi:DNA polymerase-3 subunit delta